MIRLAVIGKPVEHSRSPDIHHAFAAALGLDVRYERILGTSFVDDCRRFFGEGGVGLNVTVPFKEDAFELAATRTARAELAQAVNTLYLTPGAAADALALTGDTTDGAGLVADLEANHGVGLQGQRVLVLGAGGAVRGVLDDLAEAGVAGIDVLNRTHARAEALEGRFRRVRAVTVDTAGEAYDVIINGTSTGLVGEAPVLPAEAVDAQTVGYEMVYGPLDTPFMADLRRRGAARLADGLGMLVEQASRSFEIWTGARPDTGPVIAELRVALGYGS